MIKKLFETTSIGRLEVKNRIVRSATHEIGGAKNGEINSLFEQKINELACGGVGTIVTGLMGFEPNSGASQCNIRIDSDTFERRFQVVCEKVHQHNTKIIVQLCHCGPKAYLEKDEVPVGPSTGVFRGVQCRELNTKEIKRIIKGFADGAAKCQKAGADGVQIHAAHGYLVSHFLSPLGNQREDAYGGNLNNRARFLYEIYDAIRDAVGDDFHISVKINGSDLVDGGFGFEECIQVCKKLESKRIDSIEVSGGGFSTEAYAKPSQVIRNSGQEGYFAQYANDLAAVVDTSIICVGGHRNLQTMEKLLNSGCITALSMSRPLICEPDLPRRWQQGETLCSKCISCNACYKIAQLGCKHRGILSQQ